MKSIFAIENAIYETIAVWRHATVRPIVWIFWKMHFSADSVSILKCISGSVSAFSLSPYIAITWLVIAECLDSVDGELAQRKGANSEWGVFVDIGTDFIIFFSFILAVAYKLTVPWYLLFWFAIICLFQWPLGALVNSFKFAHRLSCGMGLVRQIPKYLFIITAIILPSMIVIITVICTIWVLTDFIILLIYTRAILVKANELSKKSHEGERNI